MWLGGTSLDILEDAFVSSVHINARRVNVIQHILCSICNVVVIEIPTKCNVSVRTYSYVGVYCMSLINEARCRRCTGRTPVLF